MGSRIQQQWREFIQGKPGQRFQARYRRGKKLRKSESLFHRFLKPGIALILLTIGIAFFVLPGPGIPLLLVGGALLADQSLRVAKFFDYAEVRIRQVAAWTKAWWEHTSAVARSAIMVSVALSLLATAYLAFHLT
jgi:hypothetical protein